MLWKVDRVRLDDFVPVPKSRPGRHFSSGHHILGNLSSTLDAKYGQMTYGEHYRKKVEAALSLERQRYADLLTEQKKNALGQKTIMPKAKKLDIPMTGTQPRFDLNELRHNQRRCAALLFGARERGAHKLPILVRWAPKRRESYYLMSERVYNDRLLMKMRAEAGDSPLNFDFANTNGETDDLLEFQKFINKTSQDIKDLSFDTKYKQYSCNFNTDKTKRIGEEGTDVESGSEEGEKREAYSASKAQRKVVFGDHVSKSDLDLIDSNPSARSKQRDDRDEFGGLDASDINFSFEEFRDKRPHRRSAVTGEKTSVEHIKSGFSEKGSMIDNDVLYGPQLQPISRETSVYDDYSSDFTSDSDMEAQVDAADEKNISFSGNGDKFLSSTSEENLKHQNKHCKHAPKQKTHEYYKRLPRLLKTSELRAKLPPKTRSKLEKVEKEVDHSCMELHKIAYDRALTLARFRSLPLSHSFLSQNISNLNKFSYFHCISHKEKMLGREADESDRKKEKKVSTTEKFGREAIFGNIDMDDFYTQEDELIYYIRPEELKNVVDSSAFSGERKWQKNE